MIRAALLGILLGAAIKSTSQGIPYASGFESLRCELMNSFADSPKAPQPPDTLAGWLGWKTVANYTFGKNRGNLVMIADLEALHPYFRELVKTLIARCKANGIELAVVETFRTRAKQNEYRAMGKSYTRSAGGSSKHQYGLAVDVVPMKDSVAVWHSMALWRKVGAVGEKLGLRWGGRWRHPFDPGHFEWAPGVSTHQLAQGQFPPVPAHLDSAAVNDELARLTGHWRSWETEQTTTARQRDE